MAKLGDLVVNIGANTKQLNKELGKVRRSMRSMSGHFNAVGQSMTRSLTMPLALIGGAAVKLAVDFEGAMAQVKAVSGATAGEFKRLEQSAKDLGASTVFTAGEVAALQLEYSRLGFSADEIIQVQEATLNLAQATGSDLAQAADVAGSTLRAFGLDASETTRVTDVMAASFNATPLQIDSFADSMKYVAPIAKAAGISLEETTAMLGVLAKSGIRGSQAGTALRRIMQEMVGTSGTLTDRFKQLSAKGIGLTDSMDEVGRRAATSLLVLTDGAGQVDELTGAFGEAEGAAKTMADIINDNTKGALKEMTSALEGAGIALGEVLLPFVTDAANFIKDLATRFKDLSKETKESIVKWAAFAAAMGPVLIMLPKIVMAMQALRVATLATSSGMVGLGNVMGVLFGAKTLLGPTKYVAGLRSIVKVKQLLMTGLKRVPIIAATAFAVGGINSFIGKVQDAKIAVQRFTDHLIIMRDMQRATDEFIGGEDERLQSQASALQGSSNALSDYTGTLEVLTLENARFWESYENGEVALAEVEGTVRLSQGAYDILKEKMGSMVQMSSDMLPAALNELRNELQATIDKLSDTGEETLVVEENVGTLLDELKGFKDVAVADTLQDITVKLWELAGMSSTAFATLSNGMQTFKIESSSALLGFLNDFEAVSEGISAQVEQMDNSFVGISETVGTMFGNLISDTISGADALSNFAISGIRAAIALAKAQVIANATGPNAANIASGGLSTPAFIVAGLTMLDAFLATVPALAEGGLSYGPQLAMVGDNKNARMDPEVIAPLSKLKDMIGGGATNVYGRISGDDIVISNSRAARDRNRYV